VSVKKIVVSVFLLLVSISAQQRGNGDRVDSFPSLFERQLLVLTDACRMAPAQYRDLYIGNYQVLLPANYPAVRPLYWNLALNKSSHMHSIDMAVNCGMQHPSCDGTAWNTRIESFYNNKSSMIGENIATGNPTALATLKQWILEVNPATTPVPVDKDSGGADGHRKNIMSASYRELGCGYAYSSTRNWNHFWTQDFGGGRPDFNNPLVAGSHFFIETGKTTFFVDYFDSSGIVPTDVSCTIEGQKTAMALALGAAGKGTYSLVQTKGTLCRQYFFSCLRNGVLCRYPEYGMLSTSGEGTCTRDYFPPESLAVVVSALREHHEPAFQISFGENNRLRISGLSPADYPATLRVIDVQGRTILFQPFSFFNDCNCIIAPKLCSSGTYVAIVKTRGEKTFSGRFVH
jgi:hypothetical protein